MSAATTKTCLLILLLASIACLKGLCQATSSLPLTYQLKAYTILQECDSKGNELAGRAPVSLPVGARFTITRPIKDSKSNYIIQFWDWSIPEIKVPDNLRSKNGKLYLADNTTEFLINEKPLPSTTLDSILDSNYYSYNYDPTTGIERYFLISSDILAISATPLVALVSPVAGAVVMPFKFRPTTGDFTKDITFSGMGGIAFNLAHEQKHTASFLLGLGITSVALTPKNSTATETVDRAAITLSFASLYQWNRLQIGLLIGADFLGEGSDSWKYNRKAWLAAGVGFNVFKPESTDAKNTSSQ
ncbi:MAG TPA: hypothetical protein VFO93_12325 [Hymenobacter sp.]|uniref:hypothetical protein n=1 Tax=Hymenobacter sp. TaxID=1898978 RepID=UPI002D7EB447|nr:hypothetical protein [Hymenobacter sp.]HET9504320.1 hypothetical protein [Hymenobacter sp.]